MVLSEENKKNIINSILKLVNKISDKEYQIRAWLHAAGPDCYPYDELVNDFFQLCDPTLNEYEDFHISKNQYKVLKNFRDEFDNFIDLSIAFDPIDFLDTPEWAKVMEKAKQVLTEFNYKLKV